MPDHVHITFSPDVEKLLREGPAPVVLRAVARALDLENELTVGATVENRLSFPKGGPTTLEGLRVGAGQARRSLSRSKAEIIGNQVVSAIGSNVRHFGVHEFGFKGRVSIRSHTRVIRSIDGSGRVIAGRGYGFGSKNVAGPFSRQIASRGSRARNAQTGVAFVKGHTRNANYPARAMIRRTVEARVANYRSAIEAAVVEDLGQ